MKLAELVERYMSVMEMREIKGVRSEFAILVYEVRKIFQPIFEDAEKRIELIQEEMSNLKIEYCKKDNEDKPIIIPLTDGKTKYDGLAKGLNPEYDKRTKELINKANELNIKEVELDLSKVVKINKDKCPKAAMAVKHWEALREFIE